ncbi:MAG TPA: cytochrome P450 [Candidatus Limnocylindrales bacterium]|nr:cytochrome P450 [Candidatus Limnocylindrales bacterium]
MGQGHDVMTTDPHAVFAMMRQAGRVAQIPLGASGATGYLIIHHEDAKRALTDPRLAKAPTSNLLPQAMVKPGLSKHMLNFDGADHSRLRRLISLEFTPRRIDALRPRVQEISDSLIDGLRGKESADLIDDYAFPLPFQVICELIGVPMIDREEFRGWSNILVNEFLARSEESKHASASMLAYVQDLVARKRSEPDHALLSGLIQASDAGDRLDQDELTSLVFLLLVAGHETTVNLIGNAMLLLLRHPDRLAALRSDPDLIPAAIEEVLRFESPVKTTTIRIAVDEITFGDTTIPAGSVVFVGLMAANRDGTVFDDPDSLDLTRTDAAQHLAFGHGAHFCLGAPLARMEGKIAIEGLLSAFPEIALGVPDEPPAWRPGMLLRGLAHLPVRLI